ncbi:MAG: hypothetical protein ICV78_26385, partial [Tolypothrix sp. Co-bin9]|nr:hypothetical protein [Tolypothrix sp. Co-bin9]
VPSVEAPAVASLRCFPTRYLVAIAYSTIQESGVVETRLIASVRESEVRSEKGFIYSFISLDAVLHKRAISCNLIYVVGVNGNTVRIMFFDENYRSPRREKSPSLQ